MTEPPVLKSQLHKVGGGKTLTFTQENWDALKWAVRRAVLFERMSVMALQEAGPKALEAGVVGASLHDLGLAEKREKVFVDLFEELWPDDPVDPDEPIVAVMP